LAGWPENGAGWVECNETQQGLASWQMTMFNANMVFDVAVGTDCHILLVSATLNSTYR
jgi:hypothetical protein